MERRSLTALVSSGSAENEAALFKMLARLRLAEAAERMREALELSTSMPTTGDGGADECADDVRERTEFMLTVRGLPQDEDDEDDEPTLVPPPGPRAGPS